MKTAALLAVVMAWASPALADETDARYRWMIRDMQIQEQNRLLERQVRAEEERLEIERARTKEAPRASIPVFAAAPVAPPRKPEKWAKAAETTEGAEFFVNLASIRPFGNGRYYETRSTLAAGEERQVVDCKSREVLAITDFGAYPREFAKDSVGAAIARFVCARK